MRFAPVIRAYVQTSRENTRLRRLVARQRDEIANTRLALSEALQDIQAYERQVAVLMDFCPTDLRELDVEA